jgi:hypothetical protein
MKVKRLWKYGLAFATSLVIAACFFWFKYTPAHRMVQINGAFVEVDHQPVSADVFAGNPTDNEADLFLLVHVPGAGDYFLNFGDENYREATIKEYVRFSRNVWMLKPIGSGHFIDPLPFERLNEYRISSRGHLVAIRF